MEKRELIYLDNAATSYPKPYAVTEAVKKYMLYCGGNAGRGGYKTAMQAATQIFNCREKLSNFFIAESENAVFFTMNTTQGINMCIKGSLQRGDHVLISNIEHNAVFRPIYKLSSRGQISYDCFDVVLDGGLLDTEKILDDIKNKVRKNTTMIICTAASNICSVRPPIKEIGEFAKQYGIRFVVDGAQAAGHFALSVKDMHIDALCVPGHKGLLGPQGCGAVILGEGMKMQTLIEGGNGVDSLLGEMPDDPPERYEAGTLPIPSIVGLNEGLSTIEQIGLENVERHEQGLFEMARRELSSIKGVTLYCPQNSGSVLLFSIDGYDSERACEYLANKNICLRGGYHCAALAHKALETSQFGAVRASFGIFNRESDIEALCSTIKKMV